MYVDISHVYAVSIMKSNLTEQGKLLVCCERLLSGEGQVVPAGAVHIHLSGMKNNTGETWPGKTAKLRNTM